MFLEINSEKVLKSLLPSLFLRKEQELLTTLLKGKYYNFQTVVNCDKRFVLAPVLVIVVIFLFLNIDTLSAKYKKYKENQSQSVNKKRS